MACWTGVLVSRHFSSQVPMVTLNRKYSFMFFSSQGRLQGREKRGR